MTIEVVNYIPEHLMKLTPKSIHDGELPPVIRTRAITVMKKTWDGKEWPIAILGGALVNLSTMHVWGFISEDVRAQPLKFHKTVLHILNRYGDILKIPRFQMDVRVDYEEGAKWAESLGFQREGVMKKYFAGRDHYLYGRTSS